LEKAFINLLDRICYKNGGTLTVNSSASQGGLDISVYTSSNDKMEFLETDDYYDFIIERLLPHAIDLGATGSSLSWSLQRDEIRIESFDDGWNGEDDNPKEIVLNTDVRALTMQLKAK